MQKKTRGKNGRGKRKSPPWKRYMREKEFIVESGGVAVCVRSWSAAWAQKICRSEFLAEYIPDPTVSEDKNTPVAGTLLLKRGAPSFSGEFPKTEYRAPSCDEKDIISIIEFLFERAREERGVYCIHSSSAIIGGKAIIFFGGATGMGKTRLALRCGGIRGGETYSDEKTLIDFKKEMAVGGVQRAYLEKHFYKKRGTSEKTIVFSARRKVPIAFFVYPFVEESARKTVVECWDAAKFEWHLYEESSRKIRGVSRRVSSGRIPVMSADTPELARRRIRDTKYFTKKKSCYYMRGTESAICIAIKRLVSRM
jgi:hypothetical protein